MAKLTLGVVTRSTGHLKRGDRRRGQRLAKRKARVSARTLLDGREGRAQPGDETASGRAGGSARGRRGRAGGVRAGGVSEKGPGDLGLLNPTAGPGIYRQSARACSFVRVGSTGQGEHAVTCSKAS